MKSKTIYFFGVTFLVFASASVTMAESLPDVKEFIADSRLSAYRQYKDVSPADLPVPTVVEVSFGSEVIERFNFTVENKTSGGFEPYLFKQETRTNETPFTLSSNAVSGLDKMSDRKTESYAEFLLPDEGGAGFAEIRLKSGKPITSSAVSLILDNHVALPNNIEISATTDAGRRVVVARRRMDGQTVQFPKTKASDWTISFSYNQPLRISELQLVQDDVSQTNFRVLRFLAKPGLSYRIYFDPDRNISLPIGESGNFFTDEDVVVLPFISSSLNSLYLPADVDQDKIRDIFDNCVSVANPLQDDVNGNGRGDACDDFDRDGIINSADNCPDNPNRNQEDEDGDKIGNVCDGEESRVTERLSWLPWAGMGLAGIVLVVLIVLTLGSNKKDKGDDGSVSSSCGGVETVSTLDNAKVV